MSTRPEEDPDASQTDPSDMSDDELIETIAELDGTLGEMGRRVVAVEEHHKEDHEEQLEDQSV